MWEEEGGCTRIRSSSCLSAHCISPEWKAPLQSASRLLLLSTNTQHCSLPISTGRRSVPSWVRTKSRRRSGLSVPANKTFSALIKLRRALQVSWLICVTSPPRDGDVVYPSTSTWRLRFSKSSLSG